MTLKPLFELRVHKAPCILLNNLILLGHCKYLCMFYAFVMDLCIWFGKSMDCDCAILLIMIVEPYYATWWFVLTFLNKMLYFPNATIVHNLNYF
jgi:hypothetical protein